MSAVPRPTYTMRASDDYKKHSWIVFEKVNGALRRSWLFNGEDPRRDASQFMARMRKARRG